MGSIQTDLSNYNLFWQKKGQKEMLTTFYLDFNFLKHCHAYSLQGRENGMVYQYLYITYVLYMYRSLRQKYFIIQLQIGCGGTLISNADWAHN